MRSRPNGRTHKLHAGPLYEHDPRTYRNRLARFGALHPTVALPARGLPDRAAGGHGQHHDSVRDLFEDPTSRRRQFYRHSHARTYAMRAFTVVPQDIPEPEVG